MAQKKLTHLDEAGRPHMVDVTGKADTNRVATATGLVRMQPATFKLIMSGGVVKGDVLSVAQVAGIMAAKKTPDLIPLCRSILDAGGSVAVGSLRLDRFSAEMAALLREAASQGIAVEFIGRLLAAFRAEHRGKPVKLCFPRYCLYLVVSLSKMRLSENDELSC